MAIDPSIPLQAKAPQMQDPLEQYGRVQALKANQLAMQEGQRKIQTQNAFRNALASGADLNDPAVVNKLMGIDPTAAMSLQEGAMKMQQAQQATQKGAIENFRTGLDFVTSPQAGANWLTAAFKDPVMGKYFTAIGKTPEQSLAEYQQMVAQPGGFEKWRQQAVMGTEKMLDHLDRLRAQDVTKRGQDISAATARRGQDMTDARARQSAGASGGQRGTGASGTARGAANTQLTQGVARLRSILEQLNESKALRGGKASKSFAGDLLAGIGSSGVGQIVQGAVSTGDQKLRDEYNAVAMSLLPAYMASQGLGSKQMDTPEERRMMLKAFGSPELTYEANVAQLNALEGGAGSAAQTGSAGAGLSSAAEAAYNKYKRK